ncbi:MAG: acyl--CoA ligase [Halioglobus sp.]|nr:acyl--CoA ligase [Halioglobus sp.]
MGLPAQVDGNRSIVSGVPLALEPGMGALTIPGYLREVAARYGEREAVVLPRDHDAVRWTYDDLLAQSTAVARALVACGVERDTRVGILMTNRPEYLAALFGTAMAGGISVALSTFSTAPELEHLLAASDVAVLLFERTVLNKDFTAVLAALEPGIADAAPGEVASERFRALRYLVGLDGLTAAPDAAVQEPAAVESWADFLQRGAAVAAGEIEARADRVQPTDPGGLFFSSGTTSLPKGILHTQQAFAIQWWRWPRVFCVREPARCWTGNGFFWSGNVTMVVGTALSTGGAVILQPLFDAEAALALIQAEQVTMLNGRPHQWARLKACAGWEQADLSSLHYVTKGEIVLEHPTVHSDWAMPNSFGTTETMTILSSIDADATAEDYADSFGVPLPGNTLKVVNPATGAVVPVGERGEICIKGPTLMLGYTGVDASEVFDAEGYFHTGDGGYVDAAGRLYWEGRLNDIIKTGGANVSPEEVDTVIAALPGVKRTQTVGVPHETLSEMVVACIVPVEGAQLEEGAIIACLKERLASYKVPRRVLFFDEADIALTGNEKIKTAELRKMAVQRLGATQAEA